MIINQGDLVDLRPVEFHSGAGGGALEQQLATANNGLLQTKNQ